MAKATEHAALPKSNFERQPDLTGFMEVNGAYFEAAMKSSEALFRGMAALQQEMVQFTSERVKDGFEASQSLMGCSHPAQAFGVQCDVARKATQEFLAEANKMMTLAAKITGDCWEPLQDRTKETLSKLGRP